MRIIAGEFRSRKLLSPPAGSITRPIPDRVKESLFGILRGNIEGATVLDAFAGTGAIGLEAVSRGAARVVMIERDKRVADVLRRNVEMLGVEDRAEVVQADALGMAAVARCPRPVDLVFFDPPYPMVNDGQPGGGWDRVKGQFSRMIEHLSDGGFAVLRTPWPFRQFDDPTEAESWFKAKAKLRNKSRGRGASEEGDEDGGGYDLSDAEGMGGDGGDDEAFRDDDVELTPEEIERLHEQRENEALVTPKSHEVDLKMAGAIGPETHAYRHTALHLYMRKR